MHGTPYTAIGGEQRLRYSGKSGDTDWSEDQIIALAELSNFPKSGSPQVGRDSEKRVLEARSRLFPAIRGQDPFSARP
jgi:hypothetical protein